MGLPYNINSYRMKVRITQRPLLLVEGMSDKLTFQTLIDEAGQRNHELKRDIDIDTAEMIESPADEILGNREKIEEVCRGLVGDKAVQQFVAFVDREFREFSEGETIVDMISGHRIDGHVVWSKGHSLENYYFDFVTLRQAFRTVSETGKFTQALDKFERIFGSALLCSCAVGLAGRDVGNIEIARTSINWETISITSNSVSVDQVRWAESLRRKRYDRESIEHLIRCYIEWVHRLSSVDLNTVRWLCHGHVGLSVLWAIYGHCVFEVSGDDRHEVQKILKEKAGLRAKVCVEAWVQKALDGNTDFPQPVMEALGLLPRPRDDRDDISNRGEKSRTVV